MNIVIVGAGASGCMSALKLAQKNNVTLIDKNDKILKKVLLSGSGKCNYYHDPINASDYNSLDDLFVKNILDSNEQTFEFLNEIGIFSKNKNGYLYPYSESSFSVKELFERRLISAGVNIMYNTEMLNFQAGDEITVSTNNGNIVCDKLIIASGGCSYPKTGSDGMLLNILRNKGININKCLPALTSVYVDFPYLNDWSGVRATAFVSSYINGVLVSGEAGEVQFTDRGLSGICVFNLSSALSRSFDEGKNCCVKVNFLPEIDDVKSFLFERDKLMNNPTLESLFESVFHYKLLNILFKFVKISRNAHLKSLTDDEIQKIVNFLSELSLNVCGIGSFDKAQVTTGGVSLEEINDCFELKKIKNVHVIGEALDVDGKCGGYNLAFCFMTGFLLGDKL